MPFFWRMRTVDGFKTHLRLKLVCSPWVMSGSIRVVGGYSLYTLYMGMCDAKEPVFFFNHFRLK